MTKDAPQLNIKLHFNDSIAEEAEQALFSQLFDILGVFEKDPTDNKDS